MPDRWFKSGLLYDRKELTETASHGAGQGKGCNFPCLSKIRRRSAPGQNKVTPPAANSVAKILRVTILLVLNHEYFINISPVFYLIL